MIEDKKPRLLERILSNSTYAGLAFFFSGMHTYRAIQAIKEQDIENAAFYGVSALIVTYVGRYFLKRIKEK